MLDFSYGYQKSEINFHVESPFGSIERERQFMSILGNEKLQSKTRRFKVRENFRENSSFIFFYVVIRSGQTSMLFREYRIRVMGIFKTTIK